MRRFIRSLGMLLAGLLLAQTAAAQQVQLVIDQTLSSCVPSTTNTHLCTFDVLAGTNGPAYDGESTDVYLFAKGKVLAASTSATSFLKAKCKISDTPTPKQDLKGNWKNLVKAMGLLQVVHLSVFICERKGNKKLPLDGPKTLHFEYQMEVDNSMLKNKDLRTCAAILGPDYATVGAPYSCVKVDVTPAMPSYDVEVDVPSGYPYLTGTGHGNIEWRYRLRNDGDMTIPAGTRLNLRVEVPGRIKVFYVDSLTNGNYSAGPWTCEKMAVWPDSLKHADGTYWKLRTPMNLVCSYVTKADIAPNGLSDTLRLYTDGGHPSEMCAFGSSFSAVSSVFKRNVDPDKAESCYNYAPPPGSTFDLSLESIGGGTPLGSSLFMPWIKNVGGAALEPGSGPAGFTYEADIPAGAKLTHLQVHLGWRCEDPAGGPNILLPDPNNGTAHPKERLLSIAGPFTLKCRYTTPFEFGAQANIRRDSWSYPVIYFVSGWPKGTKACARITAIPKGKIESNTKNNEFCAPP